MTRKIFGAIVDTVAGGTPVQGLRVSAWDEDWLDGDDYLGRDYTNQHGEYQIVYPDGLWDPQVPSFSSWRPDIYITVEIKNSQGTWVHLSKSQVFKDQNMEQDLRIDLGINLEPLIQIQTEFTPPGHGFRFLNSFRVKPQIFNLDLEQKGMGFCGGMCAGALNRFLRNISIPDDREPPQQGTPLFDELKDRQVRSMHPNVLTKMFRFQSAPDQVDQFRKSSIGVLTKREWPALKIALDDARPAILVLIRANGMFDNPTKNHQVLAIGYHFDPATRELEISEYDPNKPDQTQTLSMNLGLPGGRLHIRDSAKRTTRGFFVSPVSEEIST